MAHCGPHFLLGPLTLSRAKNHVEWYIWDVKRVKHTHTHTDSKGNIKAVGIMECQCNAFAIHSKWNVFGLMSAQTSLRRGVSLTLPGCLITPELQNTCSEMLRCIGIYTRIHTHTPIFPLPLLPWLFMKIDFTRTVFFYSCFIGGHCCQAGVGGRGLCAETVGD